MHEVRVELGERGYSVVVGEGSVAGLRDAVASTGGRVVVVSSPRVWRLHGARIEDALGADAFARVLTPDGERHKGRREFQKLHDAFIGAGLARDGLVVAFGGGVVGDLAGFAAATFMRGVDWLAVPTTLLSMVDSSIGGKVGINHPRAKNLIGAFHQPRRVIADTTVLRTLPARELRSGAYEMLKCGIIGDPPLFEAMSEAPRRLASWPGLEGAVAASCALKARIVSADEREGGLRRVLNLGHTVGHAFEAVTAYRRFTHGEAVGWGLVAAARIAHARGHLPETERDRITAAVDRLGARPRVDDLAADDVLAALARDKKARAGRVPFILPTAVGTVVVDDEVTTDDVRGALAGMAATTS